MFLSVQTGFIPLTFEMRASCLQLHKWVTLRVAMCSWSHTCMDMFFTLSLLFSHSHCSQQEALENTAVLFIEELVCQLMLCDPQDKLSADHVRASMHSALPQIKCQLHRLPPLSDTLMTSCSNTIKSAFEFNLGLLLLCTCMYVPPLYVD